MTGKDGRMPVSTFEAPTLNEARAKLEAWMEANTSAWPHSYHARKCSAGFKITIEWISRLTEEDGDASSDL
jgi:hypothetical protein